MSIFKEYVRVDMLIGGDWVPAVNGGRREIFDPATGELVGDVAYGDEHDAEAALAAATRAFPQWARTPPEERAKILHGAAALIRERLQTIAVTLTREQGKPLVDSRKEIEFAARVFDYYAELMLHRQDDWRRASAPDLRSLVLHQPVGVVVAIVPWNYPVDLFSWKVAPALAAGCSVVCKPASQTPLASAGVTQCLVEAGLPAGVLNYVVGPGSTLGETLISDPRSRMIAVTGSQETGRRVMTVAATHLKRINLELGGHSPLIVLEDADLEEVVPAAVRRSFSNMGQICIAVNRIYVARPIARAFEHEMAYLTSTLRIGPGLDEGIEYGPLIDEEAIQRVQAHIDDALARGGRLLVGGQRLRGDPYDAGHFFAPTVVADVPDEARAMREETFGPLAPLTVFQDIDELLARANATPYGLAAYIYGRDLDRAMAIAEKLEFGGVGINVNDVTELEAPFGGWKESGIGRELGREGLEAYLEAKHIRFRLRHATEISSR